MAIVNSYPMGTPKSADLLLGTSTPAPGSNEKPVTKNFGIEAVAALTSRGFLEVTKTLTNAEWIALPAASIIVVPAVTGKRIQVISAYASFTYASPSFFFSSDLVLSNAVALANLNSNTIQAKIPQQFDDIDGNDLAIFGLQATTPTLGGPIRLGTLSSATNTGGGTIAITVRYQVI